MYRAKIKNFLSENTRFFEYNVIEHFILALKLGVNQIFGDALNIVNKTKPNIFRRS